MEVTILKTAGLDVVAKWQRLPTKRTERTDNLGTDDIALMRKLILAGDEHAKAMRKKHRVKQSQQFRTTTSWATLEQPKLHYQKASCRLGL